ncbi:MAG: tetratricopeptide repeat protein [Aquabacterium sp.]|uniref:c-type cytochrome biogenesis protein CcmI/CycH n=1 Tax=Aquabacterium sp. TaxID=1872578 RepID=UPI0025C134BE|nr:tetratricopeptide repeat protein [Aquabacterium sp.]MBI5925952.1 tetratricopeptide repeat protein [Aquabacterium sp.]
MSLDINHLKTQLRQLADLHASGTLPDTAYQEAKAKLERQLLDAVMSGAEVHASAASATAKLVSSAPEAPPRVSRKLMWGMAAFVVATGAMGYYLVGTPSAWQIGPSGTTVSTAAADGEATSGNSAASGSSAPHAMNEDQIKGMVDSLVAKLKAEPNNPEGWAMLARTYAALRRFDESLPAYRKAIEQRPDEAQLYADYADALAVTQGRKLEGEPIKLIDKALSLDANNFKALSLSGTIAYDKQDYKTAASLWERAVQHAPADNPALARQMRAALDDARQRAGLPVLKPEAAQGDAGISVGHKQITGTVTLSAQLAGKVSPDDTVFIYAKAAQGPKMPLAIIRKQVRDLPYQFELNDAQAMAPQFKLSGFSDVIVTARVSKGGDAMPQSGDWIGQSGAIKTGAQNVTIEIKSAVQ